MTDFDKFSWLTDGEVDYELKRYKMLAILSNLKKELSFYNVWPVIENVEAQLDYLYRVKYEIEVKDEQLKVAKDIDFINFEIIYEQLNTDQSQINEILDSIVDDAIVEFGDLYMDARSVWRDIESKTSLTWVPNKPPLLNEGYIAIPFENVFKVYYFEKPTKMNNSWRNMMLQFIEDIEKTEDGLLKFYDSVQNDKETLMFARISVAHLLIPHKEAILPVAKSILFNRLVKDFV